MFELVTEIPRINTDHTQRDRPTDMNTEVQTHRHIETGRHRHIQTTQIESTEMDHTQRNLNMHARQSRNYYAWTKSE